MAIAIDAVSNALGNALPVVSHYIAAVGGLGTAAYGLVDASKGVMGGSPMPDSASSDRR